MSAIKLAVPSLDFIPYSTHHLVSCYLYTMASISVLLTLSSVLAHNGALAAPFSTSVGSAEIDSSDLNAAGQIISISAVNETIFGQDSTRFDYFLTGHSLAATESIKTLASAISGGTEHDIVLAFLNSTMAGTMTAAQAADDTWKCQELSDNMAYTVSVCPNPTSEGPTGEDPTSVIEKRGRWSWIRSAKHVASNAAVQILYGALGNAAYANFPSSPRSWCNSANGGNACISWSNVESFQHYFAQSMVSDALSQVDFNHNSAQANGILGSRKRHAADVCISNRADGCT